MAHRALWVSILPPLVELFFCCRLGQVLLEKSDPVNAVLLHVNKLLEHLNVGIQLGRNTNLVGPDLFLDKRQSFYDICMGKRVPLLGTRAYIVRYLYRFMALLSTSPDPLPVNSILPIPLLLWSGLDSSRCQP